MAQIGPGLRVLLLADCAARSPRSGRLALPVDREAIERENKRLVSRLKFAGLRQDAAIEDLDTKAIRGLDKALFASAIVYVRQSTPQQVQSNLESQRWQYELVEVARRRGFTDIDVITMIVGHMRAAPSNGPASIVWSLPCAPGRLALGSVSTPLGSLAMAVTVIISWNYADWWRPASSTLMACTTPLAGRSPAARDEGQYQRVRAADHPIQDV